MIKKTSQALSLFILSLTFGRCQQETAQTQTQNEISHDTLATNTTVTETAKPEAKSETWIDSLLNMYMLSSENELIKLSIKRSEPEEWLFDQVLSTDTATYLVYRFGQDVVDEDGQNPRFSTHQWVYIDSSAKTLYEYDLPNDSLIRWVQ